MKKILFFSLIGILINGCVFKTVLPKTNSALSVAEHNKPIDEPANAPKLDKYVRYNNSYQYVNNPSCNWRTRDSITCRIKRIQKVLGDLESNAVSAIGGIGNCTRCNW